MKTEFRLLGGLAWVTGCLILVPIETALKIPYDLSITGYFAYGLCVFTMGRLLEWWFEFADPPPYRARIFVILLLAPIFLIEFLVERFIARLISWGRSLGRIDQ